MRFFLGCLLPAVVALRTFPPLPPRYVRGQQHQRQAGREAEEDTQEEEEEEQQQQQHGRRNHLRRRAARSRRERWAQLAGAAAANAEGWVCTAVGADLEMPQQAVAAVCMMALCWGVANLAAV